MKMSLRCSQYSQQIPACFIPISYSGKDTATAYQSGKQEGTPQKCQPTASHAPLHPLPTALSAPWHLRASCIFITVMSLSHSIPCPPLWAQSIPSSTAS